MDNAFDTGAYANANGAVFALALQGNGAVVIGGVFNQVGGMSRNRLARLHATGALDTGFNPNVDGQVESVAVQADGKVLIGGYFTTVGGTARSYLARVYADGTLETSFIPAADGPIKSIAVQADGKILIGGYFTMINGAARNHIARLHADGTLDADFNPNADAQVTNVTIQADGRVVPGGAFTVIGGMPRRSVARLHNDAATSLLSATGTTQVLWNRGGAAPELAHSTFELSTDGGSSWSMLGAGIRVGATAHWQMTGLALPASGLIRARGWTAGRSSSVVETTTSFPDETTTQPPLLVLPFSEMRQKSGSIVTFQLPEAAQPGSVRVRYRQGATVVSELFISSGEESTGEHSFVLHPGSPTSSPAVLAGTPIPDGDYQVEVAYRDVAGNAEAISTPAWNVMVDTVTLPPVLQQPAAGGISGRQLTVQFTMAEQALAGSVKLTFDDGMTQRVWTLHNTFGSAGSHLFTVLDTMDPTAYLSVTAGGPVPSGRYEVTLSYQDAVGNVAASAHAADFELDLTEPVGGTMALAPTEPVDGSAELMVSFSDWADPNGPLSYTVLIDDVVVSSPSASLSHTVTGPATAGEHTLKGWINDTLGNVAEVTRPFTVLTAQQSWRKQHFGTTSNEGDAADTADPDGDGGTNLFEFVAGLVPTSALSRFSIRIEEVPEQPEQKAIIFSPRLTDRTYVVKYKLNLTDPMWTTLENNPTSDNGSERTVIDLGATPGPKFYHVEITRP